MIIKVIVPSDSSLLSSCEIPANAINFTIVKFVLNLDYSVFSQKNTIKKIILLLAKLFMVETQFYEYSTVCVFLDVLRTAALLNTFEELFLSSVSQRCI